MIKWRTLGIMLVVLFLFSGCSVSDKIKDAINGKQDTPQTKAVQDASKSNHEEAPSNKGTKQAEGTAGDTTLHSSSQNQTGSANKSSEKEQDTSGGSSTSSTQTKSSSESSSETTNAAATPQKQEPVSIPQVQILDKTTVVTTKGVHIEVSKTPNGLIFKGHEGKVVLLEMYGWNCPHCIAAIPGYNRLRAKYPKDVYIITIENYGTIDNNGLQQYVKNYGIQYDTVARENGGKIFAFVQSLTGYTVAGAGVPSLLILARDGSLAEYLPPQDLPEAYVDSLIQGLK